MLLLEEQSHLKELFISYLWNRVRVDLGCPHHGGCGAKLGRWQRLCTRSMVASRRVLAHVLFRLDFVFIG